MCHPLACAACSPSARCAEGVVLVPSQYVRRESIGVRPRLPLGVGEQKDLACVCLTADGSRAFDPASPCERVLDRPHDRVPELHVGVVRHLDLLAPARQAFAPYTRIRAPSSPPAAPRAKYVCLNAHWSRTSLSLIPPAVDIPATI